MVFASPFPVNRDFPSLFDDLIFIVFEYFTEHPFLLLYAFHVTQWFQITDILDDFLVNFISRISVFTFSSCAYWYCLVCIC